MATGLTKQSILDRLSKLEAKATAPSRYLVAFSGGVDSTVLLHALACTGEEHGVPLVAVHVDHGMHAESAGWAAQCQQMAADFGVAYIGRQVHVSTDGGTGPRGRGARGALWRVA